MNNEIINKCINEYSFIHDSDKYVSIKEFDAFFDKYKNIFQNLDQHNIDIPKELLDKIMFICNYGYSKIQRKNELFISKKLEEYRTYFDEMFKNIDPNINLDDNQRRAIIIDEDYTLIVAGAGSGKTTTMVAKVKYLVEKKNVKPSEIILLAFTNKAAQELNMRINDDFKLNLEVLTFHKLGMKFIRQTINRPVKIITDNGMKELLSECVTQKIFTNKNALRELITIFSKHCFFDDRCLAYATFDEYYEYYMDKKYEECKNNLETENSDRIANRLPIFKTINGEFVKSEGEFKIANYLYTNGINYKYEKIYKDKLSEGRSYSPDFTIINFGENVYLEYYGMASLKINGEIIADLKYLNEIKKKRELHASSNNQYIEIFGSYESNTNYLKELKILLKTENIINEPRTNKEIFYRLMETSKDGQYTNFIKLISLFISRFKELKYQREDFDLLINKTDDEIIKRRVFFAQKMYEFYQNYIEFNDLIDFSDMINYAYRDMEKIKIGPMGLNYKYMIIDEYQDISQQRFSFAKKLSDLFAAKIVAVGDDWQAIFAFSGADISLFTKFYDLMGYAEIISITNTYRNSQELIDLAGDFVSKNTEQFQKQLHSIKHLDKPVEIIEYDIEDENSFPDKLSDTILKIYNNNPKDKILLLGRYNDDIDKITKSNLFYVNFKTKVILKKIPDASIEFMTVHSAKGLGYDQVVLLNSIDDLHGFPSKIVDDPLIALLKDENPEVMAYAEERRLFYVALTRTKNKIYIMTPKTFDSKSEFIKEIIDCDNVKITRID